MNGRIEISLVEYNALKDRIKSLESVIAKQDKDIEEKANMINGLNDSLNYVVNETTYLERMLQWNSIVKAINGSLVKT